MGLEGYIRKNPTYGYHKSKNERINVAFRARNSKLCNVKHALSLSAYQVLNHIENIVNKDWEASSVAKFFYGAKRDNSFAKDISSFQAYLYSLIS